MTLGEFLKRECGSRAPWNCSTMPADWTMTRGHPDFAAKWRDIVEPDLCDATSCAARGLLNLWDEGIGTSLPVVSDLEPGDIGVITALGVEAGAIWTGERWATRSRHGLAFLAPERVRLLKAWRP